MIHSEEENGFVHTRSLSGMNHYNVKHLNSPSIVLSSTIEKLFFESLGKTSKTPSLAYKKGSATETVFSTVLFVLNIGFIA